jgi:hypothetical protein
MARGDRRMGGGHCHGMAWRVALQHRHVHFAAEIPLIDQSSLRQGALHPEESSATA